RAVSPCSMPSATCHLFATPTRVPCRSLTKAGHVVVERRRKRSEGGSTFLNNSQYSTIDSKLLPSREVEANGVLRVNGSTEILLYPLSYSAALLSFGFFCGRECKKLRGNTSQE